MIASKWEGLCRVILHPFKQLACSSAGNPGHHLSSSTSSSTLCFSAADLRSGHGSQKNNPRKPSTRVKARVISADAPLDIVFRSKSSSAAIIHSPVKLLDNQLRHFSSSQVVEARKVPDKKMIKLTTTTRPLKLNSTGGGGGGGRGGGLKQMKQLKLKQLRQLKHGGNNSDKNKSNNVNNIGATAADVISNFNRHLRAFGVSSRSAKNRRRLRLLRRPSADVLHWTRSGGLVIGGTSSGGLNSKSCKAVGGGWRVNDKTTSKKRRGSGGGGSSTTDGDGDGNGRGGRGRGGRVRRREGVRGESQ